jgi:hypothetical protein
VADKLGLVDHLRLGKGIVESAHMPASLAACAYEAIIGALYLDGGLEPSRNFILKHMAEEIDHVLAGEHRLNYKSLLQQHAQHDIGSTPAYEVLDEKGPDHAKAFEVAVVIRGRRYPSSWGPSKKAAEQRAAMEALRVLGRLEEETTPLSNGNLAAAVPGKVEKSEKPAAIKAPEKPAKIEAVAKSPKSPAPAAPAPAPSAALPAKIKKSEASEKPAKVAKAEKPVKAKPKRAAPKKSGKAAEPPPEPAAE